LLKSFPLSAGDYSGAIVDAQYANVETVKCKRQIDENFSLHHAFMRRNPRCLSRVARSRVDRRDGCSYMHAQAARECCRDRQESSANECCGTRMTADANMHSNAVYA